MSTSNQLEDHFDLLTSGHKMSDSHQINTNYDDQFADLLGDISENGLHNDVLNKNNTADSDHLTVCIIVDVSIFCFVLKLNNFHIF